MRDMMCELVERVKDGMLVGIELIGFLFGVALAIGSSLTLLYLACNIIEFFY